MTDADMNKYRALLLARRAEVMRKSYRREDICIVQCNDQLDTIQLAGDREFAVRAMERGSKSLIEVTEALKRMDDGEFGICLECEEPISAKRLAAAPWAAYCLHCQEEHERRQEADADEPKLAA